MNAQANVPAPQAIQDSGFTAALLGSVFGGVMVVDSKQRIIACNSAAEEALGIRAADVLEQPLSVLPGPMEALIRQSCLDGIDAPARLMDLESRPGRSISVGTAVSKNAAGELLSVVVEIQDLARASEIAANLEQLDRLASLGIITAGVAHELKNAFVAVRTFFDLFAAGEPDAGLCAVAAAEMERMDQTVRRLLRGARRDECRLAPLSVHAILEETLSFVRHEVASRGVALTTEWKAQRDRINGDERQLRHVLINFIVNALEAMPTGGELSIRTAVVDAWERDHIRVSIADTGSGMTPEHLERLFSPFFTTKPEGTGLGLAISQRIVSAHNGAITVKSEPGKGAQFDIFLPLM